MAIGRYSQFLLLLCAIGVALFTIGYLPTRKMIGAEAMSAMLTGGGLSFMASVIGSIPLVLMGTKGVFAVSTGAYTSMMLRLFLVLGGSLVIAIIGPGQLNAILIWVGISYLGFLCADVLFALSGIDHRQGAT